MSKDFEQDQPTKEQSNSLKAIGLSLVFGIALIAAIAQSVPVWVSVLIALPIAGFLSYHVIRFIKRTFFGKKPNDGGSSTH